MTAEQESDGYLWRPPLALKERLQAIAKHEGRTLQTLLVVVMRQYADRAEATAAEVKAIKRKIRP